jgi:septum formation protein
VNVAEEQKRFTIFVDDDTRILINRWLGGKKVTLASGSPRRREILETVGLDFEVVIPPIDEDAIVNVTPKRFAVAQAICKLQSVNVSEGVVIAADTIVVLDDKILGKPTDREDARRILRLLSGEKHMVYTALALRDCESGKVVADAEASQVIFRKLSDQDIEDYVDSGEPLDKAGAYGIQGMGEFLVDRLDGHLNNVIGFPLELFVNLLRELAGGA